MPFLMYVLEETPRNIIMRPEAEFIHNFDKSY